MTNRTRWVLTLGILLLMVVYSYFIMMPYTRCFAGDGNPAALGLTFGYSVDTVFHFIRVRDIDTIRCYQNFLRVWDCLFPFVYTALFILWFRFLFNFRAIILAPLLLIAADLCENFTELSMLKYLLSEGEISEKLVHLGSFLTQTKWTLAGLNVLLFTLGILRFLNNYVRKLKISGEK